MAIEELIFVTLFNPLLLAETSCLSPYFHGNYREGPLLKSLFFKPDADCLGQWEDNLSVKHYLNLPKEGEQLVWIEKEAVDEALLTRLGGRQSCQECVFSDFLDNLQARFAPVPLDTETQQIYSTDENGRVYDLLYENPSSSAALLSTNLDVARTIDTFLPPFYKVTVVPQTPTTYQPIPPAATRRVKEILTGLKYNPLIASVVGNISIPQIKNDIRFLTGEDEKSGIVSRHSFSTGAITAANWLKERVEETGAKCRLMPFRTGFAPNVICRYDAIKETDSLVLISGHYDSRGSFGRTRAPGGDDDGSGTTGVLSIARTIGRKGVKFHTNVELAFFAGEEQGLLGSKAYARELRGKDADIILMVQADMTAYRAKGEPLQLGLPDIIGSPEVTQLVSNVSSLYSPELHVGITPACCSDHQSFHENGFPATQVFERAGPIVDPMYHNSGDLSDRPGYDFDQLFAIAKVQFATVLHAAGFELSK